MINKNLLIYTAEYYINVIYYNKFLPHARITKGFLSIMHVLSMLISDSMYLHLQGDS